MARKKEKAVFDKDLIRAVLMEELIDRVTLLTAKATRLGDELDSLKGVVTEDKKQLNYIN